MTDFAVQLQSVLDALNLTAYGAGHLIAAETDENPTTIQRRWDRWKNGKNLKTLDQIQSDLEALSSASGMTINLKIEIQQSPIEEAIANLEYLQHNTIKEN